MKNRFLTHIVLCLLLALCDSTFSQCNSLYPFVDGSQLVFANYQGKIVKGPFELSPNFETYDHLGDDGFVTQVLVKLNPYLVVIKDGKNGIINDEGDVLLNYTSDSIVSLDWYSLPVAMAKVFKNGKYGVINVYGKTFLPTIYDELYMGSDYSTAKKNGFWGLLDSLGNVFLNFQYDDVNLDYYNSILMLEKDGKKSVISFPDKKPILPFKYPNIEVCSSYLDTVKYFCMRDENNLTGVADYNGKILIEPSFEKIEMMTSDLWVVRKDGKTGLYNIQSNQLIIPLIYDYISVYYDSYSTPKLFKVTLNDLVGLIDSTGKEVVPIEYTNINDGITTKNGTSGLYFLKTGKKIEPSYEYLNAYFYNGKKYFLGKKKADIYILDDAGKTVYKTKGNRLDNWYGAPSLIQIGTDKGSIVYDLSKKIAIDIGIKYIVTYTSDYLVFQTNEKYGIYFFNNKKASTKAIYNSVTEAKRGLIINEGEQWKVLKKDGTLLSPIIFDYAKPTEYYGYYDAIDTNRINITDCFLVQKDHKTGLLDMKGEMVIPMEYQTMDVTASDLLSVSKDNMDYFVNLNNQMIYPPKLSPGYNLSNVNLYDSTFTIEKDLLTGICDWEGNIIIPASYHAIFNFSDNGFAMVKLNEKYGLINRQNQVILPCIYDELQFDETTEIAKVTLNNNVGFIDAHGKTLIPLVVPYLSSYKNCMGQVEQNGMVIAYMDSTGKFIIKKLSKKIQLENGGNVDHGICMNEELEVFVNNGNDWDYYFKLPDCFYTLKNLRRIEISFSDIDSFSPQIANLSNLEYLDISSHTFHYLPKEIAKLKKLDTLMISTYGEKELEIPNELSELDGLNYLSVNTHLLPAMPKLPSLNLYCDSLPDKLVQFINLRSLCLNGLKGTTLSPLIGDLSNLILLQITSDELTELPASLGQLKKLTSLEINASQLVKILSEIGELSELQTLWVKSYYLNEIPPEIGSLKHLKKLIISSNGILGFPSEISGCSALDTIITPQAGNTLGCDYLAQLPHLRHLTIATNDLPIMPQLISLDLNCDSLNENLGFATQLQYLKFSTSYEFSASKWIAPFFICLIKLQNLQHLDVSGWGSDPILQIFIPTFIENIAQINQMRSLKKVTLPSYLVESDIQPLKDAFPKIEFIVPIEEW